MARIAPLFREIMETLGTRLDRRQPWPAPPSGSPRCMCRRFLRGSEPREPPRVPARSTTPTSTARCWSRRTSTSTPPVSTTSCPLPVRAHVAYKSSGQVIGLKQDQPVGGPLRQKRPQVQESARPARLRRLLKAILDTEDVAVIIEAKHMCVSSRGIEDEQSSTVTADYHGVF